MTQHGQYYRVTKGVEGLEPDSVGSGLEPALVRQVTDKHDWKIITTDNVLRGTRLKPRPVRDSAPSNHLTPTRNVEAS
jgi:signal transduction histidine kinase